ncbi:MAG TPA: TolC family protein [Candidatus Acidoferrales bacterium]|nr:TolC family protein [Candidatus Acidoferrales bacterium]
MIGGINGKRSLICRNAGLLLGSFFLASFCQTGWPQTQSSETLTLRQAVTLAMQNSRELKLARVQYSVALNEANVDRAAFRPNLYTGAGYVYTYGFPSLPGGGPPSLFQLNYNQAIFNPMLRGEQKAAEERAKNQKLEIDRIQDDVMLRTANAYLELGKVRHSLELIGQEQDSAQKILEVTRERVSANQELPIEITRGELELARIREKTIKLNNRDDILSEQIRTLTGFPDSQAVQVETEQPAFAATQQEPELLNLAFQSDRGILEAENERAAREHVLRGAHLSYWPTIDFVGQYSILSKFNNYGDFYKTFQRNNLNVGVVVTIPLFAAKTSADVALAKSQLNAAELSVGNRRQEVRLDVQQKTRTVAELDATREVARLDLKLAQENVQIVQARYDQGRVTLQEVEQARLDENDKWIAFLDADFAKEQAQLSLLQATGQLAKVLQ